MSTYSTVTADVTAGHLDSVVREVTGWTGNITQGRYSQWSGDRDDARKIVDILREQGEESWVD